jgi:hypothetical protein
LSIQDDIEDGSQTTLDNEGKQYPRDGPHDAANNNLAKLLVDLGKARAGYQDQV